MKLFDQSTVMIHFLVVILIQVTEGGRLNCNSEQFAERNEPFVVACNVTDPAIYAYWYAGNDTSQLPILAYENGSHGGTEYQKGDYELTSDFSLKIIRTQLKHEKTYTLRMYFQNFPYEEVTTAVRVYDLPSPQCPYIDVCGSSCKGCTINANTSGYLVCYVNGSRPGFDIHWSVETTAGINYAKQERVVQHDKTRDTMYTERGISYTIDHQCGTNATLNCVVNAPSSWPANILETNSISVQIKSENCHAELANSLIWIITAAVGLAVICLTALSIFVRYRRKEKKEILVNNLSIAYEKFCRVKPLPWEECISISALYVPTQCTVTEENGKTDQIVSSDLLKEPFISRLPRAIFIADFGNGKTSFTKYFVNKWITSQGNKKDGTIMDSFILIHVHLKDCKVEDLLPEIVKGALPKECKLATRDVDDILHIYDSIVVLSGLDEMSMSTRKIGEEDNNTEPVKRTSESHYDVESETVSLTAMDDESERSKLTIGSILGNTFDRSRYQRMKVWVTSSYFSDMDLVFPRPYSKIRLGAVSEKDTKVIIRKTCKHYLESRGRYSEVSDFEKEVAEFIEINEIVKNFCETPLFLMMIVFSITSRLVNPKKYESVNLNQITKVMKLVILCLERRYSDKFQKKENSDRDIKELEIRLGELACKKQFKDHASELEQELGKENTEMAKQIGFVKYHDKVELGDSQGRQSYLMFCHEYFKEYLAARYTVAKIKTWDRLKEYIKISDDEGTTRLLRFMCGLNHPDIHGMFRDLLARRDMWNVLIDCMYEINDTELKKTIITEFKKKYSSYIETPIINIRDLERRYHKVALTDFCKICCEQDIKLSLMFKEECSTTFVGKVTLPPLLSLVFAKMTFDKQQYDSLVTSLTSGERNIPDKLRFVGCKMPGNVEEHSKASRMEIHESEEMPPQQPVVH